MDIVKRLRLQAEYGLLGVPDGHNVVSYGDAADEIERLRARLAEVEAALREARIEIEAARTFGGGIHGEWVRASLRDRYLEEAAKRIAALHPATKEPQG